MRKSIIAVLALAVVALASSCEKAMEEPFVEPVGPATFAGRWHDPLEDRTITISDDLSTIVYQDPFLNAKARNVQITEEDAIFTVKYSLGSTAYTYQIDLSGILIDDNVMELTQLKFVSDTPDGKSEIDNPVNFGTFERQ